MGYSDAYQKFIMVDIGASGRQSDGGVLNNGEIGIRLKNNELNLPPPEPLTPGGVKLPYVMVGDEAFALSNFMMRPYPRSSESKSKSNRKKRVFNYRLSRARTIVGAAFGTLTSVWQVFRGTMKTSLSTTIQAIKARVCLHNFTLIYESKRKRRERLAEIRKDISDDALIHIPDINDFNPSAAAKEIREHFANYFMKEGKVDFQWEKARNGDF